MVWCKFYLYSAQDSNKANGENAHVLAENPDKSQKGRLSEEPEDQKETTPLTTAEDGSPESNI